MRIKIRDGLIPLNLLGFLLIAAIIFVPSNILRIILGIPFVLFFPGYTLMVALVPGKERISGIERVALSLGMSIAVVPLIGLILNSTPWGINLESILYSLASLIFVMSIIAWVRIKRLQGRERFQVEFQLRLPGWSGGIWNKTLSIFLAVFVLGTLGTIGYLIVKPKIGEGISQFYVLDSEGKDADYPRQLVVGQEGRVIIGIVNHEYQTVSYRVEVSVGGVKQSEVGSIVLENDDEWEHEMSFIPQNAGERQKVEFLLYKNAEAELCLARLYFWVDVTEP